MFRGGDLTLTVSRTDGDPDESSEQYSDDLAILDDVQDITREGTRTVTVTWWGNSGRERLLFVGLEHADDAIALYASSEDPQRANDAVGLLQEWIDGERPRTPSDPGVLRSPPRRTRGWWWTFVAVVALGVAAAAVLRYLRSG